MESQYSLCFFVKNVKFTSNISVVSRLGIFRQGIQSAPLSFVRGGAYNANGSLGKDFAIYPVGKNMAKEYAYILYFTEQWGGRFMTPFDFQSGELKNNGHPLRCVVR